MKQSPYSNWILSFCKVLLISLWASLPCCYWQDWSFANNEITPRNENAPSICINNVSPLLTASVQSLFFPQLHQFKAFTFFPPNCISSELIELYSLYFVPRKLPLQNTCFLPCQEITIIRNWKRLAYVYVPFCDFHFNQKVHFYFVLCVRSHSVSNNFVTCWIINLS